MNFSTNLQSSSEIDVLVSQFDNLLNKKTYEEYYIIKTFNENIEIIHQTYQDVKHIFEELEQLYNAKISYENIFDGREGVLFGEKIIELPEVDDEIYNNMIYQHEYVHPICVNDTVEFLNLKYNIYIYFKCIRCDAKVGEYENQMYILEKYQDRGYLDKSDLICENC